MAQKASSIDPVDHQVDVLLKSRIFRDYQDAFAKGTGLPLTLDGPGIQELIRYSYEQESPFCTLMAKTNPACASCLALQQQVQKEAWFEASTLKCFAGLCESAAPVRIGDNLIAFLHTGHVLLREPTRRKFNRIAATLLDWGAHVDLKQLEEAYFHTRVLSPTQYGAFLRLVAIFAEHLAACSNQLLLATQESEPSAVVKARSFVNAHHAEELSLNRVAAAVNLSANYFSELFKKGTGLTFVDYLARVRVERAKSLLQDHHLPVSTIAFQVGFQSLSQFNRAFKKIAGQSPTSFRASLKPLSTA